MPGVRGVVPLKEDRRLDVSSSPGRLAGGGCRSCSELLCSRERLAPELGIGIRLVPTLIKGGLPAGAAGKAGAAGALGGRRDGGPGGRPSISVGMTIMDGPSRGLRLGLSAWGAGEAAAAAMAATAAAAARSRLRRRDVPAAGSVPRRDSATESVPRRDRPTESVPRRDGPTDGPLSSSSSSSPELLAVLADGASAPLALRRRALGLGSRLHIAAHLDPTPAGVRERRRLEGGWGQCRHATASSCE